MALRIKRYEANIGTNRGGGGTAFLTNTNGTSHTIVDPNNTAAPVVLPINSTVEEAWYCPREGAPISTGLSFFHEVRI